jgi:hypothetical protein
VILWVVEFSFSGGPWKLLYYDGAYPNRRSARRGIALLRKQWMLKGQYRFRPVPYVPRPVATTRGKQITVAQARQIALGSLKRAERLRRPR